MLSNNDISNEEPEPKAPPRTPAKDRGSLGVALLRIALGVIVLVTWWDNLTKDNVDSALGLYSGDAFEGFMNWLFTSEADGGNGSSLGFYEGFVDNVLLAAPGLFGGLQLVIELLMGLALLVGAFTRLASLAAVVFFANLFLAYFGGGEWIWTYVLLTAAALAVFLDWGGRKLGVDQGLAQSRGESFMRLLW